MLLLVFLCLSQWPNDHLQTNVVDGIVGRLHIMLQSVAPIVVMRPVLNETMVANNKSNSNIVQVYNDTKVNVWS